MLLYQTIYLYLFFLTPTKRWLCGTLETDKSALPGTVVPLPVPADYLFTLAVSSSVWHSLLQ